MAQLKDLLVSGQSRLVNDVYIQKLQAPTTAGGSTFGLGTDGQILKSNGSSTYWGDFPIVDVGHGGTGVVWTNTSKTAPAANTVFAGDSDSSHNANNNNLAAPSFRKLVAADLPTVSNVSVSNTTSNTNYYLTGVTRANNAFGTILYGAFNSSGTYNTTGVYFNGAEGVLFGAAWNDYAEFRQSDEEIEFGRVVQEIGNGKLKLVNQRLAKGCEIVSDTYGFAIGKSETCKLPIATTGRVLAYPDKDPLTFEIGACVCSGLNGTVSQMTEEEERLYPSCILGTVSEIPTYEIWHGGKDIAVNGRIWIRIR